MASLKAQRLADELYKMGFYSFGPSKIEDSDFIIGCSLDSYETTQKIPYLRKVKDLDGDFYESSEREGLGFPQMIFYEEEGGLFVKVEAYTPPSGNPIILLDNPLKKKEMLMILGSSKYSGMEFYDVRGPR